MLLKLILPISMFDVDTNKLKIAYVIHIILPLDRAAAV